jgi:hypothetical protein
MLETADGDGDPVRDRLRVDTRKWLLSKALPKIYGDKVEHQLGATDELLEALEAAGERARSVGHGLAVASVEGRGAVSDVVITGESQ